MKFYLLLLCLLAGCTSASKQGHLFVLDTGEKVVCGSFKQTDCGMTISECGPTKKRSFNCVKKVQYLYPGDAHEPDIKDE